MLGELAVAVTDDLRESRASRAGETGVAHRELWMGRSPQRCGCEGNDHSSFSEHFLVKGRRDGVVDEGRGSKMERRVVCFKLGKS